MIDATTLTTVGQSVSRYGLVAIFLWIGLLKFTQYEAMNIEPFVTNSPLFAWAYRAFGLQSLSAIIGIIEIAIGVAIATRAMWPRVSAWGSLASAALLVVTLSFMLTTPGVWEPGYGFPFPSGMPGQFLAKDLVLLGASLWTAGEAFAASQPPDMT